MYKALFVPSKNSPQILENLFSPPTLRFHPLVLLWFPLAAPVARLKFEPGVFAPLPNAATAPNAAFPPIGLAQPQPDKTWMVPGAVREFLWFPPHPDPAGEGTSLKPTANNRAR